MESSRRSLLRLGTMSLATMALPGCWPTTPDTVDPPPPPPPPPTATTVSVNLTQLIQVVQTQRCEQWCWAACISMMFGFYGRMISQEQIVASTYGGVVCWPSGLTIGQDINRDYIDARGARFSSRVVAAYDYAFRVNAINNQIIVDALRGNNPLLYCNRSHAMVVHSVTYVPTAFGPNVQRVDIIDPWPFSQRTRALTASEMAVADIGGEMNFLAQIRVT